MPKITKAREQNGAKSNKGCNCKRSGCLKNYCECYEAKIVCSSNCKCLGCKNFEERSAIDHKYAKKNTQNCSSVKGTTSGRNDIMMPDSSACGTGSSESETNNKYDTFKVLTHHVINATVQCLLAQAIECEKYRLSAKDSESMLLYEFEKCIYEIIDL